MSSFKATGIVPFDPSIIPKYANLTEQEPLPHNRNEPVSNTIEIGITASNRSTSPQPGCSHWSEKAADPNLEKLTILLLEGY